MNIILLATFLYAGDVREPATGSFSENTQFRSAFDRKENTQFRSSIQDKPDNTEFHSVIEFDDQISEKVKTILETWKYGKQYEGVSVEAHFGTVTLTGTVESDMDRRRITERVKRIHGVKEVNNLIVVEPPKKPKIEVIEEEKTTKVVFPPVNENPK